MKLNHFNYKKLKDKIKKSGLKSNYISEVLGLHRITLTFYCTGRRKPQKETLKTIAKLCRCKLGDFYDSKKELEESREH